GLSASTFGADAEQAVSVRAVTSINSDARRAFFCCNVALPSGEPGACATGVPRELRSLTLPARPARSNESQTADRSLVFMLPLLPSLDRVQLVLGHDVEHAVGRDGRGADLAAHVDLGEQLLLPAVGEDEQPVLVVADQDLAVD